MKQKINIQRLENKLVILIFNVLLFFMTYVFSSIVNLEDNLRRLSLIVMFFYIILGVFDIFRYLNKYMNFAFFEENNLIINLNLKDIKSLPKKSAIYRIINTENGKSYIGKSQNIRARMHVHLGDLSNSRHVNKLLQECYDNGSIMKVEILEVFENYNPFELGALEHLYIKKFKSRNVDNGYNLRD